MGIEKPGNLDILANSVHTVGLTILWIRRQHYSCPVESQGLGGNHEREIFFFLQTVDKKDSQAYRIYCCRVACKNLSGGNKVIFLNMAVKQSKNKTAYVGGQHFFSWLLPICESVLQL